MIVIVCTTYFPPGEMGERRVSESMRTVDSWQRHLQYEGDLRLHVADDGSDAELLKRFLGGISWDATVTMQRRMGVGASLNAGMAHAFAQRALALYAVDDWTVRADFDLTPWARLLLASPEDERRPVGMVRLGPPHPWITGQVETFRDGWGMRLDRHHYAFGHRPALYHHRMIDHYGWFAERVNAYECERMYAERFAALTDGPDIILALPSPWDHDSTVELADIEPS